MTDSRVENMVRTYRDLLHLTLRQLQWYHRLPGHRYSVQDYARWEQIPAIFVERIAVTWLRRGRVMSRSLQGWLHRKFRRSDPTLTEILLAATRRREPARSRTIASLDTFLEFVAAAHPPDVKIRELIPKVHAAHAAARERDAREAPSRTRQRVLF